VGGLGLWCFTPLSTILLLYRGGRFYWWWNRSIPRKNTDLSQVNDKLIPGGDKDIYRGKNRESTTIWVESGVKHHNPIPYNKVSVKHQKKISK
jgi:hypothetical protein